MTATFITVANTTANNVSFEGTGGVPRVKVPKNGSTTIYMYEVSGNEDLCTNLATFVTAGTLVVTRGSNTLTAAQITEFKYGGDMYKSEYDADDDSAVDEAEEIEYTNRTKIAFAASPYTVLSTDKVIEVNSTGGPVVVNLPAGVDGKQYIIKDIAGTSGGNNITINRAGADTIEGAASLVISVNYSGYALYYDATTTAWKVSNFSGVNPATVVLNSAHRTGNGSDHANVATNTTRTGNWLAGMVPARTPVNFAASPYAVLAGDVVIECLSLTGAIAINLPAGVAGKSYTIKDIDGNANANNITITPNGVQTIEGAANLVIGQDYGSVTLYYDAVSTDWKASTQTFHANTARVHVEQAVAATASLHGFIAPGAGRITAIQGFPGAGAAAGESLTIDAHIAGVTALTAVGTMNLASGVNVVAGTVNPGAASVFAAGEVITFELVYVAGGGPTPIVNSVVEISYVLD